MTVAVVGLGLIGGSFYKASAKAGFDVRPLHHDQTDGLEAADLVLVCLPPDAIVPWIAAHAHLFRTGAVVVDICGVKAPIMRAVAALPRDTWTFVGGHPMAGREVSGYANSLPTLFVGASMILTPFPDVSESVLTTLRAYFKKLGFHETVVTTPAHHDEMIAFTSQLCHVIATAYARDPHVRDAVGFSAGSYANMTRIATQDAAVWRTLYLANRASLLPVVDGLIERLTAFRAALDARDAAQIETFIDEGTRAKRQELLDRARGDECLVSEAARRAHPALDAVRHDIDALDDDLVRLLVRRMELIEKVSAAKRAETYPGNDPHREEAIVARLLARAPADAESCIRNVYAEIFKDSKIRQIMKG